MTRTEVRIDQRDRQVPSHQLGFRSLLSVSQLGSKKIYLDDERKGTAPSECLGEGRLPDAWESVDVDEPSDTPIMPRPSRTKLSPTYRSQPVKHVPGQHTCTYLVHGDARP